MARGDTIGGSGGSDSIGGSTGGDRVGGGSGDRDNNRRNPRRGGKRRQKQPQQVSSRLPGYAEREPSIGERVRDTILPSGSSPGVFAALVPGAGALSAASMAARSMGMDVQEEGPAEGRDTQRRRRIASAGDTPVGPLTGSADEEGGEAGTVRRRPRTVLGAANVRRPMLGAGAGRTFLGR